MTPSDEILFAALTNAHCTLKVYHVKKGETVDDKTIQKEVMDIFVSYSDSHEVLDILRDPEGKQQF